MTMIVEREEENEFDPCAINCSWQLIVFKSPDKYISSTKMVLYQNMFHVEEQ